MDPILIEDNPHWTAPGAYDRFVEREALPKAEAMLEPKEVLAIVGARRVGKSTLAKLLIRALLRRGVDTRNLFFINLEKPGFIPYKQDPSYLQKIYEAYLKLAEPDRTQRIYFFMDEAQIFQNWEVFVKAKYESENIKFVITGSNSSLLGDTFVTLLTGRVLKLRLHTFSFTEFLRFKEIDFSTKIAMAQNRLQIEKAQEEYMRWGDTTPSSPAIRMKSKWSFSPTSPRTSFSKTSSPGTRSRIRRRSGTYSITSSPMQRHSSTTAPWEKSWISTPRPSKSTSAISRTIT